MNLTALFDQTVGAYPDGLDSFMRRAFLLRLVKVYYEAGWNDMDESKHYKELRSAARQDGYQSLDKFLEK